MAKIFGGLLTLIVSYQLKWARMEMLLSSNQKQFQFVLQEQLNSEERIQPCIYKEITKNICGLGVNSIMIPWHSLKVFKN